MIHKEGLLVNGREVSLLYPNSKWGSL